ncbi:hypothetical protein E4U41_005142 [Claviceps citrina]|nr:hypothetical protein E4U41_005142 [Claviceps citrina]
MFVKLESGPFSVGLGNTRLDGDFVPGNIGSSDDARLRNAGPSDDARPSTRDRVASSGPRDTDGGSESSKDEKIDGVGLKLETRFPKDAVRETGPMVGAGPENADFKEANAPNDEDGFKGIGLDNVGSDGTSWENSGPKDVIPDKTGPKEPGSENKKMENGLADNSGSGKASDGDAEAVEAVTARPDDVDPANNDFTEARPAETDTDLDTALETRVPDKDG